MEGSVTPLSPYSSVINVTYGGCRGPQQCLYGCAEGRFLALWLSLRMPWMWEVAGGFPPAWADRLGPWDHAGFVLFSSLGPLFQGVGAACKLPMPGVHAGSTDSPGQC